MLDVTMTCTMRPELIIRTLLSFAEKVHYDGQVRIIANIDPVGVSNQSVIKSIIKSVAKDCKWLYAVREPEEACFAAAVKWVWEQVETPIFLHLEDDWLFLKPVNMEAIEKAFENFPSVGYLCLRKKHIKHGVVKRVNDDSYITYKPGKRKYGLQPAFWRKEAAQTAAPFFDLKKDPEKQLWEKRRVGKRIGNWRCAYYGKIGETPWVKDIGREWAQRTGVHVWK